MPVDPRIQRILDAPLTSATDLRFKPVRGYVMAPGTGPAGQSCGSCRHCHPTSSTFREHVCHLDASRPKVAIKKFTKACGRWEARRR